MNCDKCSLLINSFIKSHFNYCPLIRMFCYRKSIKNVNKIQEPYLRLMTNNYKLSYRELLDLTNDISPYQRCLYCLIAEVYKCLNWLSPYIMNDVLTVLKHRYNTWHYHLFVTDRSKTYMYDRNSIPHTANQIWNYNPVK